MALEKFKPIVWSEKLQKDLDRELVAYENTNHDFEGSASKLGDVVKILGTGHVTLRKWEDGKMHVLKDPEELETNSVLMPVKKYVDFNFGVDDLDKAQAEYGGKLMSDAMSDAKTQIACVQDSFILGMVQDKNIAIADYSTTGVSISESDSNYILDAIDNAYLKLLENDVTRSTGVTMIVPPTFTMRLKRAYVDLDTNNSEMLKNGRVGRYGGITIKESNNVSFTGTGSNRVFNIPIMTNKALAFVKPMIHMESYRTEKGFTDAVKGYALYDGKVIRPQEIINLKVKM